MNSTYYLENQRLSINVQSLSILGAAKVSVVVVVAAAVGVVVVVDVVVVNDPAVLSVCSIA